MANDHGMRASDTDREAVVAVLRDAFTAGRITLEEFDERTSSAYAGRTWGELRDLTADLPVKPRLGADLPRPLSPAVRLPAAPRVDTARVMPARRRRHVAGPVLPAAVVLLMVGVSSRSPAAVSIALMLLLLVLVMEFTEARRNGGDRNAR